MMKRMAFPLSFDTEFAFLNYIILMRSSFRSFSKIRFAFLNNVSLPE